MVSNIGDELSGAKFGSQLVKCVDKTAKIPWHTCRNFLIFDNILQLGNQTPSI